MWIILGALIAAVLGFVLLRRARENTHLGQLAMGFPRIQSAAMTASRSGGEGTDFQSILARQTFTTAIGFRLVYTCDLEEDGSFLHHLSGQMVRPNRKELMMSMLLVIGILQQQFEAVSPGNQIEIGIEETETGTQHLEFALTAEQQAALEAQAEEEAPACT